jgi:transcriptional regulator with XRE-family HTH domain
MLDGAMAPMHDRQAPDPPTLASTLQRAREEAAVGLRELARRAGVSHTQISRLEAGAVIKPSREVLVALARALDRNPLPLLVLAGHLTPHESQQALRPLFREGAELPEEWGDWTRVPLDQVRTAIREPEANPLRLRAIAADVFLVQETDETLWDDSYGLAAARGEDAAALRELMAIWRYVGIDLRDRWLEYGRQLRRIADLDYVAQHEIDRPAADLIDHKEKR